ncbi:MAG: YfjI family protein [Bacillota bacterium]
MTEIVTLHEEQTGFPVEVLPSTLRGFCLEGAAAFSVPVDFLAVPVLAACSTAIGTSRRLRLKADWGGFCNLYAGVVCDTGSGKSPAQAAAFKALEAKQEDAYREWEEQNREYERDMSTWENAAKGERGSKPKPPKLKSMLVSDVTVEGLASVLQSNPRGVLLALDELTSLVTSLGQYKGGRGGDREHYLSLWSNRLLKVDRITKPPLVVPRPFISICGAIPPGVLNKLLDREGGAEDGLLHRFVFAYPESKECFWSDRIISERAWTDYRDTLNALYALSPGLTGEPEVVTPATNALDLWEKQHNLSEVRKFHYQKIGSPLRGVYAKAPSQALRLSLLLHCVKVALGEAEPYKLDEQTAKEGWTLAFWFAEEAKKVYRELGRTPEDRKADVVLNWARLKGGEVSLRDFLRYNVAGCQTRADLDPLIDKLITRRQGELVTRQTGGRPQELFRVFSSEDI